jgi:hypothetical protein
MRTRARRLSAAARLRPFALALAVHSIHAGAWAEDRIVIETGNLEPPVLAADIGHRVTFVNRSGRLVHVEFHRETGGHHVFQVPGEIWAEFHRPGRHGYVVHFPVGGQADLHGAVEVRAIEGQVYPHTCDGLTVMGACYAP